MIAYLKGALLSRGLNWAIINVHDVGYRVTCPARMLEDIHINQEMEMLIHTAVREDGITLYGFSSSSEMDAYHALTSLQGVGPSLAISLLGSMTVDEISSAIHNQDKSVLCKADGVGPKIANRIIMELGSKPVFRMDIPIVQPAFVDTDLEIRSNAIAALCGLGFRRAEAIWAVDSVQSQKQYTKLEDLITNALKATPLK